MGDRAESGGLPVGPVTPDACDAPSCGRPRGEHRENFMDLRDGVIDHDYVQPAARPYDHERVPAMVTTEWRCHACGAENDVWGTGAIGGYMECGSCGAHSWLDFDPDGYLDGPADPTLSPAEQVVARLDSYSQEEHIDRIATAREATTARRTARTQRAQAAAARLRKQPGGDA